MSAVVLLSTLVFLGPNAKFFIAPQINFIAIITPATFKKSFINAHLADSYGLEKNPYFFPKTCYFIFPNIPLGSLGYRPNNLLSLPCAFVIHRNQEAPLNKPSINFLKLFLGSGRAYFANFSSSFFFISSVSNFDLNFILKSLYDANTCVLRNDLDTRHLEWIIVGAATFCVRYCTGGQSRLVCFNIMA